MYIRPKYYGLWSDVGCVGNQDIRTMTYGFSLIGVSEPTSLRGFDNVIRTRHWMHFRNQSPEPQSRRQHTESTVSVPTPFPRLIVRESTPEPRAQSGHTRSQTDTHTNEIIIYVVYCRVDYWSTPSVRK